MIEYQIQLPEELKMGEFELKMLIASKLFEEGKLSSGQACKIAGISKRTFLELLGKYNVSVFGYNFEDIEREVAEDNENNYS